MFNVGSTFNYTYDAIGQLTFGDSATSSEDRRYVYDAAWNLNYRTNNTTTYTFKVDGKNQLTNATSVGNQTYDGNGNVAASGSANYVYDDENRLIEYTASSKTAFTYDGLGRLRKRIESVWTGSSWYPNETIYYLYDGMRVIQERTSAPTVSYTRGTDLIGSLEGAGGIGGLLARSHAYQSGSGNFTNHNCYHADGKGNITYLVNSSQTLAASYRYDPYGNTISSSGTLASANVYRFSSKEFHANSGLYYYSYRWYSPNLQRWLNRDPMGEESGYNLYTFALNAPLSYIDPLGGDLIEIPLNRFDPGVNRDRSNEFNRGCIGLCSWYQSEGCGKPKEFPEEASNTKCFSSRPQAEGYKCPDSKTPFIFAKQGNWKDGKPPKPKRGGRVPNDSIGNDPVGNDPRGHYNYVTCMGGNYYWMNRTLDVNLPMPTVYISDTPPSPGGSYPNEIWCVTCKCKAK